MSQSGGERWEMSQIGCCLLPRVLLLPIRHRAGDHPPPRALGAARLDSRVRRAPCLPFKDPLPENNGAARWCVRMWLCSRRRGWAVSSNKEIAFYCNEPRAQASREFSAKWCLMVRFRAGNYEALGRGMPILVGRCPLILSITHAVCWAEDPYILVCIVLLKIHL